ncbi:MAG: spermidine synthase, partial [Verrucomicrobiota bacterium]
GLGYTAAAALKNPRVQFLIVVDYLKPVIEWHQQGLVPLGSTLNEDARCRFEHGDFFKRALGEDDGKSFDPENPSRKFHAILLDIDHSPSNLLHERHATFYKPEGLRKLASQIHPGGVFALWSDDPPTAEFMDALNEVFVSSESHVVTFYNPLQDNESKSTVYVAQA